MSLIILIILSEILDYFLRPKKPPYNPKRKYTQLEQMSGMQGVPPLPPCWRDPQKNKKSREDAIYDGCHLPPSEPPPPSHAWVMSWAWLSRATLR